MWRRAARCRRRINTCRIAPKRFGPQRQEVWFAVHRTSQAHDVLLLCLSVLVEAKRQERMLLSQPEEGVAGGEDQGYFDNPQVAGPNPAGPKGNRSSTGRAAECALIAGSPAKGHAETREAGSTCIVQALRRDRFLITHVFRVMRPIVNSRFGAKRQLKRFGAGIVNTLLPLQLDVGTNFEQWWRSEFHRLSVGAGTKDPSRRRARDGELVAIPPASRVP